MPYPDSDDGERDEPMRPTSTDRVATGDAQPNNNLASGRANDQLQPSQLLWYVASIKTTHDGLAQPAGLPASQPTVSTRSTRSVHEASSPVVPNYGALRPDLLARLARSSDEADLVLALDTSPCGTHAEGLVADAASRRAAAGDGRALGAVIVSLQRTPHDVAVTQRLFAPLYEVARHLCAALGCADALAELETAAAR